MKENRVGGKFRTVAVWDVPPADVNLWTREQAKPRKTFALGVVRFRCIRWFRKGYRC